MDLFSSPISASMVIPQDQEATLINGNGVGVVNSNNQDLGQQQQDRQRADTPQPIPGPSRSRKRKRRMPPQAEDTCWKCKRPVANNPDGAVSCHNCGRSGELDLH